MQQNVNPGKVPLVVDVDGTLLNGDLLVEGVARLLVTRPLMLFALPFWLLAGRAALKRRVAQAVPLPPETLPLNPAVLEEVEAAKRDGREVWLASASDRAVVAPLGAFIGAAGALASDGHVNLRGRAKAARLVERFGARGFDYVANERRDLAVWEHARRAIGVGLPGRLRRDVRSLDREARFLPGPGGGAGDYVRALRPHQWIKNVLVFVPVIAAHGTSVGQYLALLGILAALCACASGSYLFNDLLDLPHDRRHRSKRDRPLAAGKVAVLPTMAIAACLMAAGTAGAFGLSPAAGLWVLGYVVAACAYSLWFKRRLFLDVIVLVLLYTVRVMIGGAAVAIPMSPWLLAFSMFIFLALAIIKCQREIAALDGGPATPGARAYRSEDDSVMTALAAAGAFSAVVVLALYVQSPNVVAHYARPYLLWLTCPLLLYWLGRMLLLANRREMDDDPVAFALRDRISWLTLLGIVSAFVAAR